MIPLWHTRNSKIKGTAYNYQVTVISTKYMDFFTMITTLHMPVVLGCFDWPLVGSERWGWLLVGLGSPWVAQRVWAIPMWVSNSFSKSKSVVSAKESIIYFSVRYRIFELFCHNENFTETMSMTIRLFSSTLSTSSPLTHLFFTESTECR